MASFNAENTEWRDGSGSLFLGQAPALHDTINLRYPTLNKLWAKQVSNRWMFDEFNHQQSRLDLLNCPSSVYQVMLMNLAYQWHADSVASRAIAPLFAPFVTNSELWEVLMENTNMEITHAKTYSEIVRQCVADPQEVFKMVMENEQTLKRAETVNKAFDALAWEGSSYSIGKTHPANLQDTYNVVFKAVCALYILERLQFMASFAATFAIVEQGYFQSIGKAVQKIMIDEIDCHAATDSEILRIELQTERGQQAYAECKQEIEQMLVEVVEQEFEWSHYLFSEGRAIVGLNPTLLKEWVLFNAQVIADDLNLNLPYQRIEKNPIPWISNWVDIDKTQNAMQEADGANYSLNVVKNDLSDDDELEF